MQRVLRKWNYKKKKYEPLLVPQDRDIRLVVDDLEEKIQCANCGKEVEAGDTYTSLTIHNSFGLGFFVCGECYNKEWEERKKEENYG